MTRLTPDEVRQVFEPILLTEALRSLDNLIEICRVLEADPSDDVRYVRNKLAEAVSNRITAG
jgi:hypothetical protein